MDVLLDAVNETAVLCDANWVTRYCNDGYLRSAGLSREQVIGRKPEDYLPGFRRSIFFQAIERCRVTRQPVSRIGYSTGHQRWLAVRVYPVGDGMLAMASDATDSVVKQHQLAQKAVEDPLTGLGNKLAMESHMESLMGGSVPFSVTVIGIERLKEINHAHGYALGDMALLEVVSALQSASRPGETLFRVSGTEFAVVRQGASDEPASLRAEALVEAAESPITLGGMAVVLRAHAGTAESPRDADGAEQLLQRAGLALHAARSAGREPSAAYRPELELASQARARLQAELRTAVDQRQFTLLIQPKVSLTNGRVCGGETLIRWNHPERGLLAPGAFLPVAQDIGLMPRLDQWVLRRTIELAADLNRAGQPLRLSMNLSVDSLADLHLAQRVQEALAHAQLPAHLLEIEIPEGALMRDVQASARVLGQLHAMGVGISIDDFGTGYSSFAYLAQFPVDALKIDRSFVTGIGPGGGHSTGRTVVQGIVRLAHSLSLSVVAEGAEDEAQVHALRFMGCDAVQGYVFAKPLQPAEFAAYAQRHRPPALPDPLAI